MSPHMEAPLNSNESEKLIFNAAFDGGNEKLYEVCPNTGNLVSYILRRNTFINDDSGCEIWNEAQQNFTSVAAYLEWVWKRLIVFTPIELDHQFSELFKDRLLQSVRASGIEGERQMFNMGYGFSHWLRWSKVLGEPSSNEQSHVITIHNFISKEPVRKMEIDKSGIKSFQDMLNRIYAAMLPTTFGTGQYGRGWTLYNLRKSAVVDHANRSSLPTFVAGDEFAVLRLAENGG